MLKNNNRLLIQKKTIYLLILYLFFATLFALVPFAEITNKVLAVAVLVLSCIWVYRCWNNLCLLIISLFILYSNYSIVVGVYLDERLRPTYLYPQITDVQVYGIGIALLFLFMITLVVLTPRCNQRKSRNIAAFFIRTENYNNLFFCVAFIAFIMFMLLGYETNAGTRGSTSALYEYNVIILLIMFFYSGNRKPCRFICITCAIAYALTSLLNGTRIEALICIIIVFLCIVRRKIPHGLLLGGMITGLMVFSCVGVIRGALVDISELGSIVFNHLVTNKMVFDTCTYAYFPMLCMIELFQAFSINNAIHYFTAFLATIFLGVSRVKDGNLIQTTYQFYFHNHGGVTIGFFWVWFSYAGAAVFALIINGYNRIILSLDHKLTDLKLCIVIYVTATVPRWYLYGPWSITRGVLVCAVVFGVFRFGEKFFRKTSIALGETHKK